MLFLSIPVLATSDLSTVKNNIIPRKVLFGNPDKLAVKLSSDGQYISYVAPKNGISNIWIAPSDDLSKAEAITNDNEQGIRRYFWSYDNQHILYLQDTKGDENDRIYSCNLKTNVITPITPGSGVKAIIYKKSKSCPSEILIGLNERDKRYFDVYKLNLIDSSKELVFENHKFANFIVDDNLKIRFAIFINEEGNKEYFENKGGNWTPFMQVDMENSKTTRIIGFDKTGFVAYLLDSRHSNTAVLKSLNLNTGETITIAEDKRSDVKVFTLHPTQGNIQAIVVNYDKRTYNILDNSIQTDIEYLRSINTGDLSILARTLDDKTWLVAYTSDTSPVKYYKYDKEHKYAEFLFNNRDDLENYTLSPMTPLIIKSRDGIDLISYITLPNKIKPNTTPLHPIPMVLVVHGGPFSRSIWGFSSVHQWLANRGYAVLDVNYRGSTGFGKNFINASNMEWGRKMHNDLIDAVHWAIESKIADPKKICIMGTSYGGYATLVGLTFTPDVFACGIDIAGPSNLFTLLKSAPPYWKNTLNDLKYRIGNVDTKKTLLEQHSPITFVKNIQAPLLIAHGANDPRVKKTESEQMVQAMRNYNIPVIYTLYYNEGHGISRLKNKLSFAAMAEVFLANTLGGNVEPINHDFQNSDFELNDIQNTDKHQARKIIQELSNPVKLQVRTK